MVDEMKRALRESASASDAVFLQRLIRTGPGEYGEGDRFLGVRVPATRKIAKQFANASLADAIQLLHSDWHEERLLALLLLVRLYKRADAQTKRAVYEVYLANTRFINNWDVVDCSAENIVGPQLLGKSRAQRVLMKLAKSTDLWERRIAMLSTFHFIRRDEFELALLVAEQLKNDSEGLIQKAVGWMLREIGERDHSVLEDFLKPRVAEMPRTMLRYAIEKFPEEQRQRYLKRKAK